MRLTVFDIVFESMGTVNSLLAVDAVKLMPNSKVASRLSNVAAAHLLLSKSKSEGISSTSEGAWMSRSSQEPPAERLMLPLMEQLTQLTLKSWGLQTS